MTRVVAGWMMGVLLASLVAVTPVRAQFRAQPEETAQSVPRTLMVEFRKLLEAKAVVVVDVRSPEAYGAGHIPGALSIPLELVPTSIEQLRRLGKPIVFYCS